MPQAPRRKPPSDAPPGAAQADAAPWVALISLLAAASYFVAFFTTSDIHRQVLSLATMPDLLISQWFGPAGTPLGLFDRWPALAVAGLILLAAHGAGRLTMDRLRLAAEMTELERTVFATAIGLNGLSLATLGLGLAGLLGPWWLFAMSVVGLSGVGLWNVLRTFRLNNPRSEIRTPKSALLLASFLLALVILLGSLLPPWEFDVREYHLQVPKEWLQSGQIEFLPHNIYGNMPLGGEMHALLAMALMPGEQGWFHGALAGKVVLASYASLTALALYCAGRRLASSWAGLVAAAVYLGHPWVVHVSTSGLNDGALAANVFLAAYALWLARDGRASYLLSGLLAGAAAACKYPGLVFAVLPLVAWALLPADWRQLRFANLRWSAGLLFVSGALVAGGPWYAKNVAQTGNPFFPLASAVFGNSGRTPEQNAQWEQAHQVPRDARGRRYSLGPLGQSAARVLLKDNLASPLIVPLVGLAVLGLLASGNCKVQTAKSPIALCPAHFALGNVLFAISLLAFVLAVWWTASHRLDRFLLPAWPLAALLAGVGAAWRDDRPWKWSVAVILVLGLGYSLLAASSQLVGDNRWFVALEHLRKTSVTAENPYGVSPAHVWLNEHVNKEEGVLLVGDAAPFNLLPQVFYNTCFDDCLLCDWTLGRSVSEQRAAFATRGIGWVVVDENELRRYQSLGNYGYDPRYDPRLLAELVSRGVLAEPQEIAPGVKAYRVRP
ncbi:MAG: glycosyltransferase family 39 protein [Pirellulaceae bacterium]|nr:glycosyltransferase family 39 protein [Pirellulaceae bacterium]